MTVTWDMLDWFRAMLAAGSLLVVFILGVQTIRVFRRLSAGQRLLTCGIIFIMIYVADAVRAAVKIHLEFQPRVIPLTIGLILLLAYCLEPDRKREKRVGRKMMDTDN